MNNNINTNFKTRRKKIMNLGLEKKSFISCFRQFISIFRTIRKNILRGVQHLTPYENSENTSLAAPPKNSKWLLGGPKVANGVWKDVYP